MAFNTSQLLDSSGIHVQYNDPSLNAASYALSTTCYSDSRLAFILTGFLLILCLLLLFAFGCACTCFRSLDYLSSELWISGEAVLDTPPAGHEDDPRYRHGAKAAGFVGKRKASKFGGLLLVCGLIAGIALSGDTLVYYSQNAG